jgi:hypothetical protein
MQRRSDVGEWETNRGSVKSQPGLTRRMALTVIAGGMGAVAWHEIGMSRKKRQNRKSRARVGAESQGGVTQRPISDFLSAQGSTSVFVPPVPDVLAWSSPANDDGLLPFAWVDYTGKADAFLGGPFGTTTSGKVLEWPQADGRAKVQVNLHTRNALAWKIDVDLTCIPPPPEGEDPDLTCIFDQIAGSAPTIFGFRAQDVDDDHPAALANSTLDVVFFNTAPGEPLQDLVTAINGGVNVPPTPPAGFEMRSLKFHAQGSGTINIPTTRPGRLTIVQTAPRLDKCITSDCFPGEIVRVQPVGQ